MNDGWRSVLAAFNSFCPTGDGGGVDPSCSGASEGGGHHEALAAVKQLHDETIKTLDTGKLAEVEKKLKELSHDDLRKVYTEFLPHKGNSPEEHEKNKAYYTKQAARMSKPKLIKDISTKITATYKAHKDNEI